MDIMAVLRMMGALGIVLALLLGALWIVRRYNLRLPGRLGGGACGRLELVERVMLDNKRAVALIRRDGREHLVLLAPEGQTVIEAGVIRDEIDEAAAEKRAAEAAAAQAKAAADAERAKNELRLAVAGAVAKASGARARIGNAARQARAVGAKVAEPDEEPIRDWLSAQLQVVPSAKSRAAASEHKARSRTEGLQHD